MLKSILAEFRKPVLIKTFWIQKQSSLLSALIKHTTWPILMIKNFGILSSFEVPTCLTILKLRKA